jgi:1,4-alpha-glucan branching enzyme
MLKKRFFKTIDECEVTFEVDPNDASEVSLLIESNGWLPIPMNRVKSGAFKARLRLPLDERFQFRYLIDGETWTNDEEADDHVVNEYGGQNSVVDTSRDA